MFYVILIIKVLIFNLLPIYSLRLSSPKSLFNVRNASLIFWLIFAAYITYVPYYNYYTINELNITHIIPSYSKAVLVILFLLLPIIFFAFFNKLIKSYRRLTVSIGLIFLLVSSGVIFGIEVFNYIQRLPLIDMCHKYHNINKEMLSCCLEAGYIWKEGFSFLSDAPPQCEKYLNFND